MMNSPRSKSCKILTTILSVQLMVMHLNVWSMVTTMVMDANMVVVAMAQAFFHWNPMLASLKVSSKPS
jgi:hypothetical protein